MRRPRLWFQHTLLSEASKQGQDIFLHGDAAHELVPLCSERA
jgi:hypothetical protein